MSNALQVKNGGGPDLVAQPLLVAFQGKTGASGPVGRFGSSVTRTTGKQIGHGIISIPVAAFGDEQAPTVAFLANGPAGQSKFCTRAEFRIGSDSLNIQVFCGNIVENYHKIYDGQTGDTLTQTVFDDRWVLEKYTCFGRMSYDPENGRHYFENKETIFNELGLPDCIDTPYGPRFAPKHRYGYSDQFDLDTGYGAPDVGQATSRARKWTAADIIRYYRDFFNAEGNGKRPQMPANIGLLDLPYYIKWPETAGNVVGYEKSIQHYATQNHTLLEVLQNTGRITGAYDLYIRAIGDFNSELCWVNMYARKGMGIPLNLPNNGGTLTGNINSATRISRGGVKESIVNCFPGGVRIHGDGPVVERFCSTYLGSDSIGHGYLTFGWSEGDRKLLLKALQDHPGDIAYEINAFKTWPLVFRDYQIKEATSLFSGTKYASSVLGATHPRIRSQQLSSENESEATPKTWIPKSIFCERGINQAERTAYQDAHGGLNPTADNDLWRPLTQFDGLSLSPDGKLLSLAAVKGEGVTYDKVFTTGTLTDLVPIPIRMNLAYEADFPTIGFDASDPNNVAARMDSDAPKFTYVGIADSMDYVDWLRINSRPIGQYSVPQTFIDRYPDRCNAGNELFSDAPGPAGNPSPGGRIMRHAAIKNIDHNRVELLGQLIMEGLNPSIEPGTAVKVEGRGTIPIFGVIRCDTIDADTQQTTLELSPSDDAVIIDKAPQGSQHARISPDPIPTKPTPITTDIPKHGPPIDRYNDPKPPMTPHDDKKMDTKSDNSRPAKSNDYGPTESGSDRAAQSKDNGASASAPRGSDSQKEMPIRAKDLLGNQSPAAIEQRKDEMPSAKSAQVKSGADFSAKPYSGKDFSKQSESKDFSIPSGKDKLDAKRDAGEYVSHKDVEGATNEAGGMSQGKSGRKQHPSAPAPQKTAPAAPEVPQKPKGGDYTERRGRATEGE